jgi:hypothetical protein
MKKPKRKTHRTHYIREDGKEIFFTPSVCQAQWKGLRRLSALRSFTRRRQACTDA